MAIEIVDLPIETIVIFHRLFLVYQRVTTRWLGNSKTLEVAPWLPISKDI